MEEPKIGERYKHINGGEYEIVCVARNRDNPDLKSVNYRSLYDSGDYPKGTIWNGSLEVFCGYKEVDGKTVKRFEYLGEENE